VRIENLDIVPATASTEAKLGVQCVRVTSPTLIALEIAEIAGQGIKLDFDRPRLAAWLRRWSQPIAPRSYVDMTRLFRTSDSKPSALMGLWHHSQQDPGDAK
jgi:hypothetical protein